MTGSTETTSLAICLAFLFAVAATDSCERRRENTPAIPGPALRHWPCASALGLALMSAATTAAGTPEAALPGLSARPPHTQDVADFPENTIHLCWDAGFGGKRHRIHPVTGAAAGQTQDFPDQYFLQNIRQDMSSLQWNLPPGVVVVFYTDTEARGEQLVIWGKGQISELLSRGFNDKASRWAWFEHSDACHR